MKIIAVVNQKGGIGKSTTATNLAYRAREHGKRVLVADLDRQGSTSLTFLPADGAKPGVVASELFAEATSTQKPEQIEPGFSIIRADKGLSLLAGVDESVLQRPKTYLKSVARDIDVCIIDTPGSIDFTPPMTVAALVAADSVVCPFPVGLYEAAALSDLLAFLKKVKEQGYNSGLQVMGLLPSKINTRSSLERRALEQLREQLGPLILPATLAERTAVKQATMRRKPVWKGTRGAGHQVAGQEWRDAMDMILNRLGVL